MSLPTFPAVTIDDGFCAELLAVAARAADAAAVPTLANFRQALAVDNKDQSGGFDPVTLADRAAEQAIRDVVLTAYPGHGFYGEEYSAVENTGVPWWVVDPIDGTRAYITGMPLWGTLIAVYDGEDAVLGLLDQPFLQERFIGRPGRAELHSGKGITQLNTRQPGSLDDAILQTTTTDMFTTPDELAAFERVRARVAMTRFGGDCYCYALLAMGFIDIVIEADMKPFDIQALIPIVRGAGGVVSNWQGESAAGGGQILACSNAALHEQVLGLLA